jgi:putative effector of murein hydrolase LrgA (UPF0299 family)
LILLTQGTIGEILAKIAQLLVVIEKVSFFNLAILIFCFIPIFKSIMNYWGSMEKSGGL